MNHAELSRDLAIAIGYFPESVRIIPVNRFPYTQVYRYQVGVLTGWTRDQWVAFDYRNPSVVVAMVELLTHELDCSIACGAIRGGKYHVWQGSGSIAIASANTLPEAVARAVIALKGKT